MVEPDRREATYEDLLTVAEPLVGELIDGMLVASPRPAARHARASSRLGGQLGGPFDVGSSGPGGWIILDEPELHLGRNVLVPDLAGWRRVRMPEMPDVAAFELPPDWVCEVLSPSTQALDRADKMPVYATFGVGHVWLVDPLALTLEAYRLEGNRYLLLGTWRGDALVNVEPFDVFGLELRVLWEQQSCSRGSTAFLPRSTKRA